ncbi:ATP12 family chaperone protein [Roseicyclus persicicus]|uniref:ATPase n=1 Tax=Roseicyclus persicicus TaxID=2650661 RepID=A0A7X6GZQ7_9RHOB|nr:ATP12 family protein [Roseibacterium persicicum]NKX45381.1 ATPase [Roseibacterium persicicum]
MTGGWKARRFWREVSVGEAEGGFSVHLDARRVMTPGKLPLTLPTRVMAEAIAAEWAAQDDEIRPLTMPVTRAANSALERVVPQQPEVAAMLAAYAETDLTCHRADTPEALQARQAAAWDPLLDWAAETHGARLLPTVGILPVAQPQASLDALAAHVAALDAFRLTALHDLVTLSGSLVIGLATAAGRLDAETGWSLSRIDEDWQIEQWGPDEEAEAAAAHKRAAFHAARRFWDMAGCE